MDAWTTTTAKSSFDTDKKRSPEAASGPGPTKVADPIFNTGDVADPDNEKVHGLPATDDDAGNYPSGFKLTVIIISLILAIFLASLDMVSPPFRLLPPCYFHQT